MVVLMGLSFMLDKYLIAENFSSLHRTFLLFTIFILWYSWTFDLWACWDLYGFKLQVQVSVLAS